MSDKSSQITAETDEQPRPGESFLSRFHRRKTEARQSVAVASDVPATTTDPEEPQPQTEDVAPTLTDADMPDIETLNFESDFSGFLSEKVSRGLRRQALRKLFHSAELNVVDGLDEYAEDFTSFAPLGDIVTADMRHMIEVEARKKAEALKQALLEEQKDEAPEAIEEGNADRRLITEAVDTDTTSTLSAELAEQDKNEKTDD
jgi:hypothetical protein